MTAFLDTNVLIRHLTGEPPEMAERAGRLLASGEELLLPDLILAEVVYVLESFYEVAREDVAELARSIVAHDPVRTTDPALLLRTIEVYDAHGLDFADAYLVASAEASGVRHVASFDHGFDRVPSVGRVAP